MCDNPEYVPFENLHFDFENELLVISRLDMPWQP